MSNPGPNLNPLGIPGKSERLPQILETHITLGFIIIALLQRRMHLEACCKMVRLIYGGFSISALADFCLGSGGFPGR